MAAKIEGKNQFRQQFDQLQDQQIGGEQQYIHKSEQRNYGNCKVIAKNSRGEPWLVLGPHWYIFMIAFFITIGLLILMLFSLQQQISAVWFYILIVSSVIYAYSYLRIGFSNPGFAQPISHQLHSGQLICQVCKVRIARNIYHCPDCNVCIEDFDHHCPWIGKCVGRKNLCSFYFFLIMIFGTLILCFIATIASASSRKGNNKNGNIIVQG